MNCLCCCIETTTKSPSTPSATTNDCVISTSCSYNDMTSCVRHKCLYMSEYHHRCIYRYDMVSADISKWSVRDKACGLSVTLSCNLLAVCHGLTNKLVELSADSGQCVREITLQADIEWPWHGIQLTTGQFVVWNDFGNNWSSVYSQ